MSVNSRSVCLSAQKLCLGKTRWVQFWQQPAAKQILYSYFVILFSFCISYTPYRGCCKEFKINGGNSLNPCN